MAYFYHIDDLFDFGKFKGLSLSDVMDLEPEYVRWCMFNVSSPSFIIMDEAMEELKMIYPDFLVTVAFERQRMLRNSEEEKRTEAEYIYKDYYDTYERYNGTYA